MYRDAQSIRMSCGMKWKKGKKALIVTIAIATSWFSISGALRRLVNTLWSILGACIASEIQCRRHLWQSALGHTLHETTMAKIQINPCSLRRELFSPLSSLWDICVKKSPTIEFRRLCTLRDRVAIPTAEFYNGDYHSSTPPKEVKCCEKC